MKWLGVLLVLGAVAALGLFLWPLLEPAPLVPRAQPPAKVVYTRAQEAPLVAHPAVVPSAGTSTGGRTIAEQVAAAAAEPAGPVGPLCDRQFAAEAGPLLDLTPGQSLRGGPVAVGAGWTWVSIWAAWCKPCKEEMPLLSSWAGTLRRQGKPLRVVLLSVDDDERELHRFLDGPGRGIAEEFRWIAEDAARAALYGQLQVPVPPTLPVQYLLDPTGRLRCVRVGSVGERDLAAAPAALGL